MTPPSSASAAMLLEHYFDLHNRAVTEGRPDATDTLLRASVVIEVEGPGLSYLRREAMVRAFRAHALVIWKLQSVDEHAAFANYAWRDRPRLGGLIRVQSSASKVVRLTIRPGYSRIFGLLAPCSDEAKQAGSSLSG